MNEVNVAEAKKDFLKAMSEVKNQRVEEVGGDGWQSYVEIYGPQALFAEIASITHRLKLLFWDTPYNVAQQQKAMDLLVDIGNYAGFLFEWVKDK